MKLFEKFKAILGDESRPDCRVARMEEVLGRIFVVFAEATPMAELMKHQRLIPSLFRQRLLRFSLLN